MLSASSLAFTTAPLPASSRAFTTAPLSASSRAEPFFRRSEGSPTHNEMPGRISVIPSVVRMIREAIILQVEEPAVRLASVPLSASSRAEPFFRRSEGSPAHNEMRGNFSHAQLNARNISVIPSAVRMIREAIILQVEEPAVRLASAPLPASSRAKPFFRRSEGSPTHNEMRGNFSRAQLLSLSFAGIY